MYSYVDNELEGAKIRIAVPSKQFNGNVVIFCHGCRPIGIPLVADLDCENDSLYNRLLSEGWIIGMTSYRLQGLTVRDAISDVDLLRDWICENYGLIDSNTQQRYLNLVLLEGHSMGGAIVTHIAERDSKRYHGVIAVGAALLVREYDENGQYLQFKHRPSIPMIYLTNSDETNIIEEYIEKSLPNGGIRPALWTVFRNGHVNVNDDERTKSFDGIMEWINSGTCLLENDVTTVIQPENNTDIYYDDEGIWGKVLSTDSWGDIITNIEPKHLYKIGIHHGDSFKAEFGGKRYHSRGTEVKLLYGGNSFLSVDQGELFAFDEARGFISMSANGYAKVSKMTSFCKLGDTIRVLKPIGKGAALTGIPGGVDDLLVK